ncbi:MAG: TldD/PmbA family protein [Spirochaetales bacterium]|nr:TldD/PmbA family protein [Spirochaetales bacterium]
MINKDLAKYSLKTLVEKGATKAQITLSESRKQEFNIDSNQISLLRTTYNNSLAAMAIKDNRKGFYITNRTDRKSIEEAAGMTMEIAEGSEQDPAYDIAGKQPPDTFSRGNDTPDTELMYDRIRYFLEQVKERYPRIIINQSVLDFSFSKSYILNSNGIEFEVNEGAYSIWGMLVAKEGKKSSSFNTFSLAQNDLQKDFLDHEMISEKFSETEKQIVLQPLAGKFEGNLIITPEALGDLLDIFCSKFLTDIPLISGTSLLKDSLGKKVAGSQLTLHSAPLSKDLAYNQFVTNDGFRTENSIIINKGTLNSLLLSLYGANKTGKARSVNNSHYYIVEPGGQSKNELISSVKRGVYLVRMSGGQPNDKGDFSFVAKNSFLIEDGKIGPPISEVMVSGNILDLFNGISGISRERYNYGNCILPWIKAERITIHGK